MKSVSLRTCRLSAVRVVVTRASNTFCQQADRLLLRVIQSFMNSASVLSLSPARRLCSRESARIYTKECVNPFRQLIYAHAMA